MGDNNNQQLNNKIDSNSINLSHGKDLKNSSSNNDSEPFHEFEHKSFNYTKLQEEYGEPKKESSSIK